MVRTKVSKPLLGIVITPEEMDLRDGTVGADFQFKIGRGSFANPLFYSSPKLRELMAKHSMQEGRRVGYIEYHSDVVPEDRGSHNIRGLAYPFYHLRGGVRHDFNRKGIATELERKALAYLRRQVGSKAVINSKCVSEGRARQLAARGITARKDETYQMTVGGMQAGINKLRRQKRKEFRPKLKAQGAPRRRSV